MHTQPRSHTRLHFARHPPSYSAEAFDLHHPPLGLESCRRKAERKVCLHLNLTRPNSARTYPFMTSLSLP